ncbi:ribosomal L7Ae/L30e/S12e/Gadd45 family protein [Gudongella sp. DL1XJH-153]|uniref:ribosomal L7Ae/L30e/S12e/Gadd45 family protein n=1 Tax=Gudongella sp. DL1XJH-153 TaxID=3409804 RepID=UPI003BB77D8D
MFTELNTEGKVVGAKQVKRALSKSEVQTVFIARDAEKKVTEEIEDLCKSKEVVVQYIDTMEELGEACGIDINAAVAALLNKN